MLLRHGLSGWGGGWRCRSVPRQPGLIPRQARGVPGVGVGWRRHESRGMRRTKTPPGCLHIRGFQTHPAPIPFQSTLRLADLRWRAFIKNPRFETRQFRHIFKKTDSRDHFGDSRQGFGRQRRGCGSHRRGSGSHRRGYGGHRKGSGGTERVLGGTERLSGATGGPLGVADTGLGVPKTSGKDRLRTGGGMCRGRIEEGRVDGSRG